MASSALKLIIREPPHRSFVQGYPGVPASVENVAVRPPAYIAGTVEVRPRPKGVRALYVRIELKKVEQVPGTKSGSRYKELIGGASSSASMFAIVAARREPRGHAALSRPPAVRAHTSHSSSDDAMAVVKAKGR